MYRLSTQSRLFRYAAGLLCALAVLVAAQPQAGATDVLAWSDLPTIPDGLGFGGPIVGVHGDALMVSGGANFPDGPPWPEGGRPAGAKKWHDRIFVLTPGDDGWRDAGTLPAPRAYAATVSTADGVYILGGETYGVPPEGGPAKNHPTAGVLLLAWDAESASISVTEDALPPLPKPSQYHAAAMIGTTIYVTASHASSPASTRLDEAAFWSLDLSAATEARQWQSLTPWPGEPREQMSLVAQTAGAADNHESPTCLYLISGSNWAKDSNGDPDLAQYRYFADGYRYNPKADRWSPIAPLPAVAESRNIDLSAYRYDESTASWQRRPEGETGFPDASRNRFDNEPRPAAAASAAALGTSHVLLFSGSTGRYVTLDVADRPQFPGDILAYHTITDTWTLAGEMPAAVVTTTAVNWNGDIVIPSGEIRPGIRTNRVQRLSVGNHSAAFGAINMIVLGLYLAALVAIGVYFSRRENSTEAYFLASKRIPWWAAGLSIYATQLSAITFVSLPAVAYATNWKVYPAQFTILFIAPIVVWFYLPFFRRLNVTTAYEYLERRFGLAVRLFGSLSFITFQLGRMAVVVYLPALALSVVTGLNIYVCILVMGVLATLYTGLGGMEAVIWTDVLQVFVLLGGMVAALVIVAADVGGAGSIIDMAQAGEKLTVFDWSWDTARMATWLVVIGSIALNFAPYTTDQAVVQRYMTTKSEKAAARSIYLNGFMTLPVAGLIFCLGTALYAYFKSNPAAIPLNMENDKIFPIFIAEHMPPGLSGLVIAGIFAASMSSLDSSIHSVATAITTDFYKRFRPTHDDSHYLRVGRFITIAAGAIGTVLTLLLASYDIQSLFFLFQKLLGLTSSGLVAVFMLGMFTRRANSAGVLLGAAASIAVLYYVSTYTAINFYLYAVIGISTALVIGYGASLILPNASKDLSGLTYGTLVPRSADE